MFWKQYSLLYDRCVFTLLAVWDNGDAFRTWHERRRFNKLMPPIKSCVKSLRIWNSGTKKRFLNRIRFILYFQHHWYRTRKANRKQRKLYLMDFKIIKNINERLAILLVCVVWQFIYFTLYLTMYLSWNYCTFFNLIYHWNYWNECFSCQLLLSNTVQCTFSYTCWDIQWRTVHLIISPVFETLSEPFEVGGDLKAAQQKYDIRLYLRYHVRLERNGCRRTDTHPMICLVDSLLFFISYGCPIQKLMKKFYVTCLTSDHWTTSVVKLWINPLLNEERLLGLHVCPAMTFGEKRQGANFTWHNPPPCQSCKSCGVLSFYSPAIKFRSQPNVIIW